MVIKITGKYGVMHPLTRTIWRLIRRKAKVDEVYIAIEPNEEVDNEYS